MGRRCERSLILFVCRLFYTDFLLCLLQWKKVVQVLNVSMVVSVSIQSIHSNAFVQSITKDNDAI